MLRLLYIDDDQPMISVLQNYFARHFEVMCLSSPKNILQHLQHFAPHIILMDVHMGAYDGRIICKEIKDDTRFSKIPLVLTSATLFTEEQMSIYKANGFIAKPYKHLDELTAQVKQYAVEQNIISRDRRSLTVAAKEEDRV